MFLDRVEFNNIRCFVHTEINFGAHGKNNRKWTVLVGENGTGTTSVLKAVALALAGSDALPELVGNPDNWIRYGQDEASIRLLLKTSGGGKRDIALYFRRGEDLSSFIDRSRESLAPLNDALRHTLRNYPTFAYGAARGLAWNNAATEVGGDATHPRAQCLRSLFTHQAKLRPIVGWAMQLEQRDGREGLETVRNVLADLLPEARFSHIDKENEQLVFETPDGLVPLSQLSEGYQNVLAWVGDLLHQVVAIFDDYRNPLNVRGVLIIEEVDLHLHPKWQRRLLHFLDKRLPRLQLLVTTYSVVTAQQTPENALHYCVRRDPHPVVERFTHDPGKFLLHQLIATEAFGQLSDESLEVEHLKAEYRSLHRKPERSRNELARMKQIENQLDQRPTDERAAAVLTLEQSELLAKILES